MLNDLGIDKGLREIIQWLIQQAFLVKVPESQFQWLVTL